MVAVCSPGVSFLQSFMLVLELGVQGKGKMNYVMLSGIKLHTTNVKSLHQSCRVLNCKDTYF